MAVQNVTSATGATSGALAGITRFTVSQTRTVTPIHHSDEPYTQCAARGGWQVTGTLEGIDPDELIALEDLASEDLTVVLQAAEIGGTAATFAVQNCSFHSFSQNSGEPGDPSTSTISFEAVSDDGSGVIITIS